MTTYTCKECGKPVVRAQDGEFHRPCGCNAPIIASLKAHARGASAMAGGK